MRIALAMLTAALLSVTGGTAMAVEFEGRKVKLGGVLLNRGSEAEGLLMNARMIQAAIEDYGNYKDKMKYPDGPWDADRNVNEFIAALPIYAQHGLNMVTVGMQGGHPRFHCGDSSGSGKRNFSMFAADGTLRSDAKARLKKLIEAADDVGIIVNVQYFYQNQDNKLSGNSAVLKATQQATEFLKSLGTGNILVEVANEVTTKNYKWTALQPSAIDDRIAQIKSIWPAALVTASMNTDGRLGPTSVRKAVDWVSFHANGETADSIVNIINRAKNDPDLKNKPIAVTEDPWHDQGSKPMTNAVAAGAGWGFYEQGCEYEGNYTGKARYRDGFQSPPVNWGLSNPSKRAFFDLVKQMTGGGVVEPPPPDPELEPEPGEVIPPVLGYEVQQSDVTLMWTDSGSELKYVVKESETGEPGQFTNIDSVASDVLQYEMENVPDGRHYYMVQANGPNKNRQRSNVVDVTTPAVIVVPPPDPEPEPGPLPLAPPDHDEIITPAMVGAGAGQKSLQEWLFTFGSGKVVLLSDPDYTYRVVKKLVPRPGQTILLEADLSGGLQADIGFDARSGRIPGVRVMGAPMRQGNIRDFLDLAVKVWIDSIVSNIGVLDIMSTGVGGGFEGERTTPAIIEFLRMRRCGSEEFLGHDAGAIKLARTGDLAGPVIRYNDIEDIVGNGIWCDVQACSADYIGNIIQGVGRKGFHWEKSGASDELGPYREGRLVVEDNVVVDSGLEGRAHASDAAFTVVSSMHAHYLRNSSQGARRADFEARQDGRLDGDKHGWKLQDIFVDETNEFASFRGCDEPGVTCL